MSAQVSDSLSFEEMGDVISAARARIASDARTIDSLRSRCVVVTAYADRLAASLVALVAAFDDVYGRSPITYQLNEALENARHNIAKGAGQ